MNNDSMNLIEIFDRTKMKKKINLFLLRFNDQHTDDNGKSKKKKTVKIANITHKIAMIKPGELYIVT